MVVCIQEESRTEDQVFLHFTITDTGIGIPEEKQKTIFGAFVQAESYMTRKYGGTGLGLSISVQLVELLGGKIWSKASSEKGAAFILRRALASRRTHRESPFGPRAWTLKDSPSFSWMIM